MCVLKVYSRALRMGFRVLLLIGRKSCMSLTNPKRKSVGTLACQCQAGFCVMNPTMRFDSTLKV